MGDGLGDLCAGDLQSRGLRSGNTGLGTQRQKPGKNISEITI